MNPVSERSRVRQGFELVLDEMKIDTVNQLQLPAPYRDKI